MEHIAELLLGFEALKVTFARLKTPLSSSFWVGLRRRSCVLISILKYLFLCQEPL